jgi:hypothetical protein
LCTHEHGERVRCAPTPPCCVTKEVRCPRNFHRQPQRHHHQRHGQHHVRPFGSVVACTVNRNAAGAAVSADVEYTTDQAGTDAIAAKNGTVLDGNRITVVGR